MSKSKKKVASIRTMSGAVAMRSCTSPSEITIQQWEEQLQVLPPLKWVIEGGNESFRAHTPVRGNVYLSMVRIGRRLFMMQRPIEESHEQLVALAANYIVNKPRVRRALAA